MVIKEAQPKIEDNAIKEVHDMRRLLSKRKVLTSTDPDFKRYTSLMCQLYDQVCLLTERYPLNKG